MPRSSLRILMLMLGLSAGVSHCALAEDDFPRLYNSEADATAEPWSAARAAAELQLPTGFSANVFASEPDVQNPIASTWDARGRLWVAENYTYAQPSQRFDLDLRDRVIILEDSDGDGASDRRTVFTDAVQMLTSVEVGHGGVWLMCPPQLLFIPDADHDDVPDGPARVVLDGFEVAEDNYHNLANGLRWGPDGWLYGRCGGSCPGNIGVSGTPEDQRVALEGGIWRYHPQRGQVEVLTHGTTNPWGHDWNSVGEGFFVNTVNGHLWHLIPGPHFVRPFTLDPNPRTYELIDMHADHWHFDTGKSWTDSRAGAANDYGGGHAHTGTTIYLGDQWPEMYRDSLLTWNMHGQRINRELLARHGSGYTARHAPDMALSRDPFFRGIDLSYGPDGSVYILDWSDTGECHEHDGVHRTSGRVYRITYDQVANASQPSDSPIGDQTFDLHSLSGSELASMQHASNAWYARQARLILAERAAAGNDLDGAVEELREILSDETSDPVLAYRALVTLHLIEPENRDLLVAMTRHPSDVIRVWAIRLLSEHWPIDDCYGPLHLSPAQSAAVAADAMRTLPELQRMATRDPSALVRLVLASTIQRLPLELRADLAGPLVAHRVDAEDHNLPLLVWYGLMPLADSHPAELAALALKCQWPKTQRFIARSVAETSGGDSGPLEILLRGLVATRDQETRHNLLLGIAEGFRGWRAAPRPAGWDALVRQVQAEEDPRSAEIVRELSVVFGDGRAIDEVRQIVLDAEAEIGLRRSALQALVDRKSADLREICMSVLNDPRLNTVAAEGLAAYDDPEVARQLVDAYRRFRSPERPKIISLLASRSTFAGALLDAVERGAIPSEHLTAYDVRQLQTLEDPEIDARIRQLWGEIRQSPADKAARIEQLRTMLSDPSSPPPDLGHGRRLFADSCAKCHRLYGEGERIGPDLTGANRNNLAYLLENVVDPSAVVSKDFRMTVILLDDGRVINGLVTARNERTLTVQTQTELQTVDLGAVAETRVTDVSPMPDGLLTNLTEDQIRDLFGYLRHPVQVAMPD